MAIFNIKKPSRTKRDGMLLNLQLLHCICVHLLKISATGSSPTSPAPRFHVVHHPRLFP